MDKMIFYIVIVLMATMFLGAAVYKILKLLKQKKYGNLDTGRVIEHYCNRMYNLFKKSKIFSKVHCELSYKLSVFNRQYRTSC